MTAVALKQRDPREDWIEARRSGIGGSDAPVVLGVSKRRGPYSLWTEKAGLVPPDQTDNEVFRWGRILEPSIAEDYVRLTGRKLIDPGTYTIQRHPKRSWQICTHDRIIEPIDDRGRGVLSIKYIGPIAARDWQETWVEQQGPIDYKVQLQHELSVSGLTWGSFGVLIWGQGVKWTDVELNRNFEEALVEEEHDFWRRVEAGDPPPVDGTTSTGEALKALYPRDNGKPVELPPEAAGWIAEIKALRGDDSSVGKRLKYLENQLKEKLKDGVEGVIGGRTVCTYRTHQRKGYEVAPTEYRLLKLKDEE